MEDKNQQPLVPDMLYRHTLPQPDAPKPEDIPLEAVFFSDNPQPEDIPLPEPEPESTVTTLPDAELTLEALLEAEAAREAAAETPSLPAETFEPAPEVPEADPLAAFLPEEPVFPQEEPAPMEPEAVPVEDLTAQAGQPVLDGDTLNWPIPEETAPQETPLEDYYQTFEPEIFPETEAPEFTDMYTEKRREEDPPPMKKKKTPPVKKGRPKRKKGYGLFGIPHLLATVLWLAIIVAIGSSLGKLLWVGAADVLAFGRESRMVTVTIVDSDTIDTIAAKLQEAGLVKYPELFKFYAKLTGDDEEITTGTFELNTILDYHALTNALSPSSSSRTVVKVTIPEGYNCRQIFNLLANSNVCSVEALEEYAASGELNDYWFLEDVERGSKYCLEGFLFPDTYEFYANSTPKEALNKMLSGFNSRFSEEMRAQIDTLNQHLSELMRANGESEEYIADNQLTIGDVLIVASLIEEETAGTAESSTIASVIYNRLYNWGDTPAYLNIDATIYYALDGNIDPVTGNTMVLTNEDLQIDSPYNTYKFAGLTPGPITNPGLSSLQAALAPSDSGYYYYVLNPETGLHQFSKTLEEHEKYVAEFYPGSEGSE